MGVAKVIVNGSTIIDVTQKTVSSNNLLSGITALGANGENVIGNYVAPTFTTQSKTVTPTESSQSIFPDSGYSGLSKVTVNAISSTYVGSGIPQKSSSDLTFTGGTFTTPSGYYSTSAYKNIAVGGLPTPSIFLGINGVINASATLPTDAWIPSSTTTSTYQIPSLAATTYTPTTTNQIISSQKYLVGSQTILGDANLVPANIASGVSIFGVNGTHEGGGGVNEIYKTWAENCYSSYGTRFTFYGNISSHVSFISEISRMGEYAFAGRSFQSSSFNFTGLSSALAEGAFFKATFTNTSLFFPNITSIGSYAFAGCIGSIKASFPNCLEIGISAFANVYTKSTTIYSISFPACISINAYAFQSTNFSGTSAKNVFFPECEYIGMNAFQSANLSNASFPKCKTISQMAFNSCKSLINIYFPECESIGNYVFSSCSKLTSVEMSKVVNIGANAFTACPSLSYISFLSAEYIGMYAFTSCSSLSSVYLPNAITVDTGAFASCINLSDISLPSISSIPYMCFISCYKLISIYAPRASIIGSYAFSNCSLLQEASFPLVEVIGQGAFMKAGIVRASFPKCTLISTSAFYQCKSLLRLDLMGSSFVDLAAWALDSTPMSGASASGIIYVPESMVDTYKTMTNWSLYSSRFVGVSVSE